MSSVVSKLQLLRSNILGLDTASNVDDFELLLQLSSNVHAEQDLTAFVRKEVFVVNAETNVDVSPLIEQLCEHLGDIGLQLSALLLSVRPASQIILDNVEEKAKEQSNDVVEWWTNVIRVPIDHAVDGVLEEVLKSHGNTFQRLSSRNQERETPERDLDFIKILKEVQDGEISLALSRTRFGQCSLAAHECDELITQLTESKHSPVFFFMLDECRDMVLVLRCSLIERRQKLRSLISLEEEFAGELTSFQLIKDCLTVITTSLNPRACLEELAGRLDQCDSDLYRSTFGRVFIRGLSILRQSLREFMFSDTPIKSMDFFRYEKPPASVEMIDKKTILSPDLPTFLGGDALSRTIALLRAVGGYEKASGVLTWEFTSASGLREIVEVLEATSVDTLRNRFLKAAQEWRAQLVFRESFVETQGFPEIFEKVLMRASAVLKEIAKARSFSFGRFDVDMLLRELECYFMQSLDYVIWPKLVRGIQVAKTIEDVLNSVKIGRDEIVEVFLLNEDVHFLALDSLLRSVETGDRMRFEKTRVFFLRCLNGSVEGKHLLEMIDHNGFYRQLITAS